jgi:hypothetical protein
MQALSTLADVSQFVKRIEVMDRPGENHFAEALAKALGPTAKKTPLLVHKSFPLLQGLNLRPPLLASVLLWLPALTHKHQKVIVLLF